MELGNSTGGGNVVGSELLMSKAKKNAVRHWEKRKEKEGSAAENRKLSLQAANREGDSKGRLRAVLGGTQKRVPQWQ